MKTIKVAVAVGLMVFLPAVGKTAEVKNLELAKGPSEMQGILQTHSALPDLHYTYPRRREAWRQQGRAMRALDRPRRNLDLGRGQRAVFFNNYVDR